MALSAAMVWDIRPGVGASTNGGAFKAGATGTDYSQQTSPQKTFTDLVIAAAPDEDNISSILTPFTAADVGNVVNITAGTGFTPGRYEVLSVTDGLAEVDRAVGTAESEGGAGRLGGSLDSIETVYNLVVAGNKVYIKSGTDTLTGSKTINNGSVVAPIIIAGYKTTHGDLEADSWSTSHNAVTNHLNGTDYPVISGGANLLTTGLCNRLRCLVITGSRNGAQVSQGTANSMYRVKITNTAEHADAAALSLGSRSVLIDSEFVTSGATSLASISSGATDSAVHGCRISSTAGCGITTSKSLVVSSTLFTDIIEGYAGIRQSAADMSIFAINCTMVNCDGHLIDMPDVAQASPTVTVINNLVSNCAAIVNNLRTATQDISVFGANNRLRDNTANYVGMVSGHDTCPGDITTDQSDSQEFADASSDDYRLKSASLAKGAGIPPYQDCGWIQRQESGGSRTFVL